MKRLVCKVNLDVMKITSENNDECCNRGRCWKYNKNVPLSKRKAYRGLAHRENVERMT